MRVISAIGIVAGLALAESADPQADESTATSQADATGVAVWTTETTAYHVTPSQAQGTATEVIVPAGTRVPLVMINSISSKNSHAGDPVYLRSVYPVTLDGRIMIPAGTHVSGSVVYSRRPGRVKGRGRLGIRLEMMILPNGVIRNLAGRPEVLDGRSPNNFHRETGTVTSPGTKGEDAEGVANTTVTGASVGSIVGAIGGRSGTGLGIGTLAGAGAGLARVLLTRGPDVLLDRGTHLEMLLEREIHFAEGELED
ncbi:MAG: hypothetical protein OXJ37_06660 [Bryobacterales bacterium]|nr:hypothetical protein [Bryobacterales bacterium]